MRAVRISIITPFYPRSIGGVEKITSDTAEELARRGSEVSVITTTYNNAWEKIAELGSEVVGDVEVHRLQPSLLKLGYATLMSGLKEKLVTLRPDIVHSHNLHPHLFQVIRWKAELGYRIVAQLHYPEATRISHLSARLMHPTAIWYLKKKQREIDTFIVHSNLERRWLIGNGIREKKVYRMNYPCVSHKLLEYNPKSAFKSRIDSEHILLYIGRIVWEKGLHILLQALPEVLSDIKDVVAVMAGPKNKKYYGELLKIAKKLDLNSHVIFKSAVFGEEKSQYMRNCTIFVSPSINDYTPATLIEAQAFGKAVISTTVGAIPEIVQDTNTGLLVRKEDPKELASAIKWLLLNDREREQMGKRARKMVKDKFLLESTVNDLEKMYKRMKFSGYLS